VPARQSNQSAPTPASPAGVANPQSADPDPRAQEQNHMTENQKNGPVGHDTGSRR
jgi:hypothetical protein